MATVLQLPESPRWLVKKGREEEARQVFAALADVDIDDPQVMLQVEEIRATLPLVEGGAVKDIFTQGKEKHFHRACLGFWAQVMQQITGINLITYYAANVRKFCSIYLHRVFLRSLTCSRSLLPFLSGLSSTSALLSSSFTTTPSSTKQTQVYETSIGLSPLNSKILAAANGTEVSERSVVRFARRHRANPRPFPLPLLNKYFIASFIAVYLIERAGRRKLMLFGAIGQALTMALLTVTVYLCTARDAIPYGGKDNSAAGIVAAILLFAFNTFFAIGWLGMTWLYPAEIVSLRIRAPSAGLSTSVSSAPSRPAPPRSRSLTPDPFRPSGQLDLQLHGRAHHPDRLQLDRVLHLHRVRLPQRAHGPDRLLPLPRDRTPFARGDRRDLPQLKPQDTLGRRQGASPHHPVYNPS